ncbi:MAG: trypsin-like peptidase domain-containing protein [Bacteroidales bacterium]|nr:trypsin-like peptidase domain-containing protein [Candidatus Cryptobacteroides aphodequi]
MKKSFLGLVSAIALLAGAPAGAANLSEDNYPDFTYAAEHSVDAVVYVEVTARTESEPYQIDDPLFRFFFGDEFRPQSRERKGSGSGVIITSDGYVVTNNHVVNGATQITIVLNDNSQYEAKLIGTDPVTDVALLKVEADSSLPYLDFADSDELRLGEWVLAIGSPMGRELQGTITAGIVSAKGRNIPDYTGQFKIESFIQTDAAVNPGNSGGALVTKSGKLVGINTAIVSTTGSYTGYSFAIPSNIVKKTVADLIEYGEVRRARLGIVMQAVDQRIVSELKLSSKNGVYIVEVSKGSAADKAGLKSGDVLIEIDGIVITSTSKLQEKVNSYRPGDSARIKYIRGGKTYTSTVNFRGEEVVL